MSIEDDRAIELLQLISGQLAEILRLLDPGTDSSAKHRTGQ